MDEHELISGVLRPGLERTGTLVVVPARMASTRLPGKPLADIGGVPMIVQVWRRAVAAEIGPVVVACAEREIAAAVERYGGIAVLTDPKHPSGSDRIHEALNVCDPKGLARIIVNVQGDLPTLDPTLIRRVLDPLSVPEVDISTLVCPITDPEEGTRPSVVKAAVAWSKQRPGIGRALYFSRATIPWGPGVLLHHIGLYAYRRAALKRFVALPPCAIEQRENLEQLRALEAGMRIDVAEVATIPLGVDTPEDLVTARRMLAAQKGTV